MKDLISKIKKEGKLVIGTILFFILGSTSIYYSNFKTTGNFYNMERSLDKPCFVGDTGTGGSSQIKVANKLKEDCKDVFYLGDVIYPQGLTGVDDVQFFEKFYDHYDGLNKYVTLGNHDTYATGQMKYWLELGKKYKDVFYPNYFYAVKFNDVCVLAFESSIYGVLGTGKFEKAQNKFVKEFTSREDCKTKIAIAHHPYLSSGKHGDAFIPDLKDFYKDYIIGKVDYVIAGHDHNLSFEGCENGTCHYVSGSGAKLRPCKKVRKYCESKHGYIKMVDGKLQFVIVD